MSGFFNGLVMQLQQRIRQMFRSTEITINGKKIPH